MCGICGIWSLAGEPIDPVLLCRMRDVIAHRGPDGAGCVMFETRGNGQVLFAQPENVAGHFDLGMASRRLSIIDLNTGDQPMSNADGSHWVVYNGEIYNYRELRKELKAHGHVFRTESDTEVILHAYAEYGEDCPEHLNGIFGFAIWNRQKRLLFLARDHFGVKPLYYRVDSRHFHFGSELKTILRDPRVPRELDLDALNLCLTFRYTPSPWTMMKGIRKLPPGCSLTVTADGACQKRYWRESTKIDRVSSEADWIQRLQQAEEAAVVRQMVSDVPIAVSLSSGVDSTTILALMSRHSSGPVRAFTVGFEGKEASSEIGPSRQRSEKYGAEFCSQVITADDYSGFMRRYMWHLEEPIGNESAAAYYFVAEMAYQRGIKVLLNGQGADEAFAGYPRYLEAAYGRWLRAGTLTPLKQMLPRVLAGRALGERYDRFLYTLSARTEEDRFTRVYSILTEAERHCLVRPEVMARVDAGMPIRFIHEQLSRAPDGTALERMTYVDARTSLADNLLLCEDKMAMAASVEARVPFLDLELMKVAEQIPGNFKLRGLRDKYIHRKAVADWVGKEVTWRPQIGFDNAVDQWLRSQFGQQMQQTISSPDSFTATYLNPAFVVRLIQEHVEGRRDHQRLLFLLLSMENWHQVFFAGGAAE